MMDVLLITGWLEHVRTGLHHYIHALFFQIVGAAL